MTTLRSRFSVAFAALCILGAAACDTSAPTATPDRLGVNLQDVVTDEFVCREVIDPVTGAVTFVLETLTGENLTPVLQPLGNDICRALAAGEITPEEFNGLASKLFAASAALQRGNVNAAVNILNAFVNQAQAIFVNRNCNGTELSGVCHTAKKLIDDTQRIIAGLLL